MPPAATSIPRKSSIASMNPTAETSLHPKRTASGRAIRNNTTRPTNYYARPYGTLRAVSATNAGDDDTQDSVQPGFFPALQYASDTLAALPKEVMRQFTLMKEVEAKIHGPQEQLGGMIDALMELPIPPRKSALAHADGQHGLLSLTASNSAMGSAAPSVVNGMAGRQYSGHNSAAGSVAGEDMGETEEDRARRKQYLDLRMLTHTLLPNLDEKNVVLSEANRVLALQLSRIESVKSHVDNEISAEARLGSMTHWAYSDNRQKKVPPAPAPSRRDVLATNSLAAAANVVHESEIAQVRRDAGREAVREKHGKGKRQQEQVDSDFDERPKKTHPKVASKSKAAAQAALAGLGITTVAEPVKRRKVDKGIGAPAMERSASSMSKAARAARETPRSTPAAEPIKKAPKPKPLPPQPKKRIPTSAQHSPALASSPLHTSFIAASMEAPPGARPQSARLRKNSSTTNLRHEKLVDEENRIPVSTPVKTNGNTEKPNGKRKVLPPLPPPPPPPPPPPEDKEEPEETAEERSATKTTERSDMKHEDVEMPDAVPAPSRSTSHSGKAGRASKIGTPRNDNIGSDGGGSAAQARSTRSLRNTARDSSSSEPQQQGPRKAPRLHKRHISSSHLVKQLAPFNRSPDLDRHRDTDDPDDDQDSVEGPDGEKEEELRMAPQQEHESPGIGTRPTSRRSTQPEASDIRVPSPPISVPEVEEEAPPQEEEAPIPEPPALTPPDEVAPTTSVTHDSPPLPELEPDLEPDNPTPPSPQALPDDNEADLEGDTLEEEDSEHDPDDPNEPKYCYCNRGSYGEMVACDNDGCAREWFHLGCTGLREAPGEEEVWYCKECRPAFQRKRGGGGGVGGGGGGGGGPRGRPSSARG